MRLTKAGGNDKKPFVTVLQLIPICFIVGIDSSSVGLEHAAGTQHHSHLHQAKRMMIIASRRVQTIFLHYSVQISHLKSSWR